MACLATLMATPAVFGQIVINEVVKEERSVSGGALAPDVREFVELFNAGESSVDLSGWSIVGYDLALGFDSFIFGLPTGATIAPGAYYVLGGTSVANVNFVPNEGVGTDLFPDLQAQALLLRDGSSNLIDAVGYDVFRTGTTGLTIADPDIVTQIGSGFHGPLISPNAGAPISRISYSRYRDGVDTNRNGYDFGILPLTPGASNNPVFNESHTVPNVDSLAVGTTLSTEYNTSFVLPTVIDPTVASAINPRAIPASPQGGNAIVAWDATGGGNAVYSRDLVNSFDLYAYFDTTPLGVTASTNDEEWESTTYGIGSTDPLFNSPDPSGGIFVSTATTANGNTGIGWVYQQYEAPEGVGETFTRLMLVDFGDGGDSKPDSGQWTLIQTIDMSLVDAGWFRLGIDYDPVTGNVVARFDDQTFNFTTETDLTGTFFVGYREAITAEQTRFDLLNPPIFDLVSQNLPGDYNGNGVVDAADYTLWRDNLGNDSAVLNGNGTGAQTVVQADYDLWKSSFGNVLPTGSASLASVPEPGSIVLLSLGLAAFACRRRRSIGRRSIDS